MDPIAYTYDADTHCPECARARFPRVRDPLCASCDVHAGGCSVHNVSPPEDARDREGNPVGAVEPWDAWHEDAPGQFALVCGTCRTVIDSCDHGSGMSESDDECTCPTCKPEAQPDRLAEEAFERRFER